MRNRRLIGGLIASALLACGPAAAKVPASGGSGSAYRVGVMSWWEIPFRRVVRQRWDFSCGSAALATLLTYHYGRPTTENLTFARMWDAGDQKAIRKAGFSMLDMKSYLTSIGLSAEGLRIGPEGLAELKRPAIVLLDLNGFKHFVVVKGVRDGQVLVGDPMLGIKEYAERDFLKLWNGIALVVVDSGAGAEFNRPSDWSPWSTAPLKDGAQNIAADNYLAHLPPTYQLVPIVLIDAHVGTVP